VVVDLVLVYVSLLVVGLTQFQKRRRDVTDVDMLLLLLMIQQQLCQSVSNENDRDMHPLRWHCPSFRGRRATRATRSAEGGGGRSSLRLIRRVDDNEDLVAVAVAVTVVVVVAVAVAVAVASFPLYCR